MAYGQSAANQAIWTLFFNSRFADDIDLLWSSEEELQRLTETLVETAAGFDMEISSNKSKIVVSSIKPKSSINIWMNGETLEEVD